MHFDKRYPSTDYFEAGARKRLPRFVWDFVEGGLGSGRAVRRNREDLDNVVLVPRYLSDAQDPVLGVTILGRHYDAPFGVAPMGLSGLVRPHAELVLAAAAREANVPFVLSTYACQSLEEVKATAGDIGWFQFYPPNDEVMEADLIDRCRDAGYDTLVVTVDIPVETRRAHDIRNGVSVPPRLDLRSAGQMLRRPRWSMSMLRHGIPHFDTLKVYSSDPSNRAVGEFICSVMKGHITAERFTRIREAWGGTILAKGVLDADEAEMYVKLGADGLVVSNHGGRQFDAAPSSITALPAIRQAVGPDVPIVADGGVRSGLDIARMIAMGADFVLIGRSFAYAVAAAGRPGADHLNWLFKRELHEAMAQCGAPSLSILRERLIPGVDRGR